MPIILFDIDGTLVRTGGAGKAAMETALVSAFGVRELRDEVDYSGRTDLAISRDLLRVHGIEPTLASQHLLRDTYLSLLPPNLSEKGGTVCPGVRELLTELTRAASHTLGLLTGNVHLGARTKLAHFGLWEHFACGGFGDSHYDRDDVARAALASARAHLNRDVDPNDVWVIGDTPLDVKCARAIGAKAVAVATGWHALAELEACAPDFALADLSDASQLLRAWA